MALLPVPIYRYKFVLLLCLLWFASLYVVFQLVPDHDGSSLHESQLVSHSDSSRSSSSEDGSVLPNKGLRFGNLISSLSSSKHPPAPQNRRNITIWSSDFHISPVADLKHLLAPLGVQFIDQSLSSHCHLTGTCQDRLRVINAENGLELLPCANDVRHDFYLDYKDDEYFNSADAILCTHACSMCELFMPFGKPLIVVASTRYEIGRYERARWLEWNQNLEKIARKPGNVVGANNLYDLEYIKFFTNLGADEVRLMPSYCGYVSAVYTPTRTEVLIAPGRGTDDQLVARVVSVGGEAGHKIVPMRELYPHYEYSDLASHKAFIILPYQVSFMLFFELYRMGIPMFVPGPKLLSRWHLKRNILHERTWASARGARSYHSAIGRNPASKSSMLLDPNDDTSYDAIYEWVQLADFYQFPHVQQFESLGHLMKLLSSVDLPAVSADMMEYNNKQKASIVKAWQGVIDGIRDHISEIPAPLSALASLNALISAETDPVPDDPLNTALLHEYGVMISTDSCIGQIEVEKASRSASSVTDTARNSPAHTPDLFFVPREDITFYLFVGAGLMFILYSLIYL